MIRGITQEIEIEEALKKKIEFICSFCNITPTIEKTNLAYVEPHRIIKRINFLAFNYETYIYVESLENKILKEEYDPEFKKKSIIDIVKKSINVFKYYYEEEKIMQKGVKKMTNLDYSGKINN